MRRILSVLFVALSLVVAVAAPSHAAAPVAVPAKNWGPKLAFANVPTQYTYDAKTKQTKTLFFTERPVQAKQTKDGLFVLVSGAWKRVPYTHRGGSLTYDEALRIKYGMKRDPLGAKGRMTAAVVTTSTPTGSATGGSALPSPYSVLADPNCDPTSQPCGFVPGTGLGSGATAVTGSYDTDPAAVAIAGSNYGPAVLSAINGVRASNGLPALAWCPAAAQAATGWANYLNSTGQYTHVANGSEAGSRMSQVGVGIPLAEIIVGGRTSPRQAVDAWLTSRGHTAAMNHPYATHAGVGIAPSGFGGVTWVVNFARIGGACV